jgi:hypothetical protein
LYSLFRDPLVVPTYDEDHSEDEDCWVTLGQADDDLLAQGL